MHSEGRKKKLHKGRDAFQAVERRRVDGAAAVGMLIASLNGHVDALRNHFRFHGIRSALFGKRRRESANEKSADLCVYARSCHLASFCNIVRNAITRACALLAARRLQGIHRNLAQRVIASEQTVEEGRGLVTVPCCAQRRSVMLRYYLGRIIESIMPIKILKDAGVKLGTAIARVLHSFYITSVRLAYQRSKPVIPSFPGGKKTQIDFKAVSLSIFACIFKLEYSLSICLVA